MAICTREFFPREKSQQGILVISNIPTPEEMMKIDKREEKNKVESETKIAITKQDSSPSIHQFFNITLILRMKTMTIYCFPTLSYNKGVEEHTKAL